MNTIPETAEELITDTWADGSRRSALYEQGGRRVGYRAWSEEGVLVMEQALREGVPHGQLRIWHDNGQLSEDAWYEDGLEHGRTRQYDWDGALIGSYTMDRGTGVDVWFHRAGVLSEERHMRAGQRHGYERWWDEDNQRVWEESHFWEGLEHGIFRRWGSRGGLARGYPRYYVRGERVSKRHYLRAAATDSTLPPFRPEEQSPARTIPDHVRALIHRRDAEDAEETAS
ncbi:MAG TPA: hypothetical protein VFS21_05790 [Roseiflexaceae bacterium]|nr:hypothetical protein [Roseiflexaceae bacterium]